MQKPFNVTTLIVTARETDTEDDPATYSFRAYEFDNGIVCVPYESTNDGYFEDRGSIQACGTDVVESVERLNETQEWTFDNVRESIEGSVEEFGRGAVPKKAFKMLNL